MTDSSWDNGGHGAPAKAGMPLWGKLLLGCGVGALVVVVTCVGIGAYVVNRAKKDPEGFKTKLMGFALDKVRPDWEDFRTVLTQLQTDEGCRALYGANPALAATWPTEAAFLKAATDWRKDLPIPPDLTPDLMDQHGLRFHSELGGKVSVGWHPKNGRAVYITFEGHRKPGYSGPRKVLEIEVR